MQILNPTPQAVYTGVANAFSRISSTEGVRTLWRGVNSVVLGAGPAHALYFGTYEFCKDLFGANATQGHHPFATGIFVALITVLIGIQIDKINLIFRSCRSMCNNSK
jgi:solute carrier family 25 iron transporter 28/37